MGKQLELFPEVRKGPVIVYYHDEEIHGEALQFDREMNLVLVRYKDDGKYYSNWFHEDMVKNE